MLIHLYGTFIFMVSIISLSHCQTVQFQWNYLNFTWLSEEAYSQAINDGSYVPRNNIITGVKVWKDRVYLTLPRWKSGVPATLVSTAITPSNELDPLLEPYPSWEAQLLDDCSALQFVQSMEIDPMGRMWVLDNGRTQFLTNDTKVKCPPRLLIIDIEDHNRVLLEYVFPIEAAHAESVFLNDIVLDHEDGGWAYITDSDTQFPGIIVFSLKDRISWKVTHETMQVVEEASKFLVNKTLMTTGVPVDGIALSPADSEGNRVLYYLPLSSFELYAVPVFALKAGRLDGHVTPVGRKTSQTDGMVVDARGLLYMGLVTEDAIAAWHPDHDLPFPLSLEVLVQDSTSNQWPDTFAMDEEGQLWWTTNRIQNFMNNKKDVNEVNDRVISMPTPARSYQYYGDGSCPNLPDIY